jgi:hypothetical protein
MSNNKKIGIALILGGVGVTFYGLFIDGKNILGIQESSEYLDYTPPPILLNDDREVFQGSQTDPNDFVRGYELPTDISKLLPINGKVSIITKPNVTAFGQGGRGMFNVSVDFAGRRLIYKQNDGIIKTEPYDTVRTKLVIADKKYIKS